MGAALYIVLENDGAGVDNEVDGRRSRGPTGISPRSAASSA